MPALATLETSAPAAYPEEDPGAVLEVVLVLAAVLPGPIRGHVLPLESLAGAPLAVKHAPVLEPHHSIA